MVSALSTTMPQTRVSEQVEVTESRVDRDSHFNGHYHTKQNLRIEGMAEGEIECEGTFTVVEGAIVKAKVTASTVIIAGELEGEVLCRDVFQIMPTGQVQATVSARRLVVHEGGLYNGAFTMINTEPAATARPNYYNAPGSEPKAKNKPKGSEDLSTEEWWSKMLDQEANKDSDEGQAKK
jgi:cytoskeletal protein CcmA (bactofilin family)